MIAQRLRQLADEIEAGTAASISEAGGVRMSMDEQGYTRRDDTGLRVLCLVYGVADQGRADAGAAAALGDQALSGVSSS